MLGGASADGCGCLVSEEFEDEIRKRFVILYLMRFYLYGEASHVEGNLAWAAVAVVGNDNVLMYLISGSGFRQCGFVGSGLRCSGVWS